MSPARSSTGKSRADGMTPTQSTPQRNHTFAQYPHKIHKESLAWVSPCRGSPARSLVMLQSQLEDAIGGTRESGHVFWQDPEMQRTFPEVQAQSAESFTVDGADKQHPAGHFLQDSNRVGNNENIKSNQYSKSKSPVQDRVNKIKQVQTIISDSQSGSTVLTNKRVTFPPLNIVENNRTFDTGAIAKTAMSPTMRFITFLSGKNHNALLSTNVSSASPPSVIPTKAVQILGTSVSDRGMHHSKSVTFRRKLADGGVLISHQPPRLRACQSMDQNLGKMTPNTELKRSSTGLAKSIQDRRIELLNSRISSDRAARVRSGSLQFFDGAVPPTPPSKSEAQKRRVRPSDEGHVITARRHETMRESQHEESPTTMMVQARKAKAIMVTSPSLHSVHAAFDMATPAVRQSGFSSTPLVTHFERKDGDSDLQQTLKPEEFLQATVYTPHTYQQNWKPADSISPTGQTKGLCPVPLKLDLERAVAISPELLVQSLTLSSTSGAASEEVMMFFDAGTGNSTAGTPQRPGDNSIIDASTQHEDSTIFCQTVPGMQVEPSYRSPLFAGTTTTSLAQPPPDMLKTSTTAKDTPEISRDDRQLADLINWSVASLHDILLARLQNLEDRSVDKIDMLHNSLEQNSKLLSTVIESQNRLGKTMRRVQAMTTKVQQEVLRMGAFHTRMLTEAVSVSPASERHRSTTSQETPTNKGGRRVPADSRASLSSLGRDRSIPDLMNHPYFRNTQ